MILVTVGGQVGFDRLVRTVDEWAGRHPEHEVFCQVLDGGYEPTHAEWVREMPQAQFKQKLLDARLIVAHAGMGTIITALENQKPIVVMPRQAALREQRNDHQLATAQRFQATGQVQVAMDEGELTALLERVDELVAAPSIGDRASDELLGTIREFVER